MAGLDLSKPFYGIRTTSPPDSVESLCRAYLPSLRHGAVFSGSTAAVLLGVPLPSRLESATTVHVTVPTGIRAPRGKGVIGHTSDGRLEHLVIHRGLPITDPASTWCELSLELSLDDLVAAGDYLVHHRLPFTTVDHLTRVVSTLHGRRGVALMRAAIPYLDERSESRRESHLRLVLVRGGIEGVRANYWIVLPGVRKRYRADFALPELRVIIEYQSDYHRDPAQWRADMTRISRLEAHGWIVIQVNADDLRDPTELIARIQLVLSQRGRNR